MTTPTTTGVSSNTLSRHMTADPLRNFRFQVNIAHTTVPRAGGAGTSSPFTNLTRLGFMTCAGLSVDVDVIPYREGGFNVTPQKMPGQANFSPVTLTRGSMIGSPTSYDWMRMIFSVLEGNANWTAANDFRCDVTIDLFAHPWPKAKVGADNGPPTLMRWKLFSAWPSSMAFGDLDSGGNSLMIEQMTLQHEGFAVAYADHWTTNAAATPIA